MTLTDITQDMLIVITNWCNDGAAAACQNLERMEDVILDEGGEVSDKEKLSLLREIKTLRAELAVFIEKGGRKC